MVRLAAKCDLARRGSLIGQVEAEARVVEEDDLGGPSNGLRSGNQPNWRTTLMCRSKDVAKYSDFQSKEDHDPQTNSYTESFLARAQLTAN